MLLRREYTSMRHSLPHWLSNAVQSLTSLNPDQGLLRGALLQWSFTQYIGASITQFCCLDAHFVKPALPDAAET